MQTEHYRKAPAMSERRATIQRYLRGRLRFPDLETQLQVRMTYQAV